MNSSRNVTFKELPRVYCLGFRVFRVWGLGFLGFRRLRVC